MSEEQLKKKELAKESSLLISLMGKLSRIDYLNRLEAMGNKWDEFIRNLPENANKPTEQVGQFHRERKKLERYWHEQGFNLDEIPQNGGLMDKNMPPASPEADEYVPF